MTNTTSTTPTLEERYQSALKDIRRAGVYARTNIMTCCRGCYNPNIADDAAIVWTYGGQGFRVLISGDEAYYAKRTSYTSRRTGRTSTSYDATAAAETVYVNHTGLVDSEGLTPAGVSVLAAYDRHGIVVEWDQTNLECIKLHLAASVVDPELAAFDPVI